MFNSVVTSGRLLYFLDDIAVDWIANNLYWVDSVWARIEALNLDSLERAEIIRVGANTRPRAIAVDPINTYAQKYIINTTLHTFCVTM